MFLTHMTFCSDILSSPPDFVKNTISILVWKTPLCHANLSSHLNENSPTLCQVTRPEESFWSSTAHLVTIQLLQAVRESYARKQNKPGCIQQSSTESAKYPILADYEMETNVK